MEIARRTSTGRKKKNIVSSVAGAIKSPGPAMLRQRSRNERLGAATVSTCLVTTAIINILLSIWGKDPSGYGSLTGLADLPMFLRRINRNLISGPDFNLVSVLSLYTRNQVRTGRVSPLRSVPSPN
jgi:hypothetical protein